MRAEIKKLNREFLAINLKYDAESPTGLRWVSSNHSRKAGDVAGTRAYQANGKPNGIVVKINDVIYRSGRVIWTLMKGEIEDGYFIDHLDGNPFNNNIDNLAMKSPRANTHNLSLASDNKTGIKGVCFYTRKSTGNTNVIAYVVDESGEKIYKSFSVNKYGADQALVLASKWRVEKLKELNESWAEYTERHIYE